jgi:hypothetical protein
MSSASNIERVTRPTSIALQENVAGPDLYGELLGPWTWALVKKTRLLLTTDGY